MKALQVKYETCNPYKKSGKRNVLILTGREKNKLPTLNDSNKEIVFDRTNHIEPAHVLQTINTLTALVKDGGTVVRSLKQFVQLNSVPLRKTLRTDIATAFMGQFAVLANSAKSTLFYY